MTVEQAEFMEQHRNVFFFSIYRMKTLDDKYINFIVIVLFNYYY